MAVNRSARTKSSERGPSNIRTGAVRWWVARAVSCPPHFHTPPTDSSWAARCNPAAHFGHFLGTDFREHLFHALWWIRRMLRTPVAARVLDGHGVSPRTGSFIGRLKGQGESPGARSWLLLSVCQEIDDDPGVEAAVAGAWQDGELRVRKSFAQGEGVLHVDLLVAIADHD